MQIKSQEKPFYAEKTFHLDQGRSEILAASHLNRQNFFSQILLAEPVGTARIKLMTLRLLFISWLCSTSWAAVPPTMTLKERLQARVQRTPLSVQTSVIFDLPMTYNSKVSRWISYFQDSGKNWFRDWLERSTKYLPYIQRELKEAGLPQDLAFMVMIESGFLPNAISHADAVGPWQFIQPTGQRYGLKVNWWLDERRDIKKSTLAAIRYMQDLYKEFGSWYLVAASYNMGEGGLRRQIQKYQTRDYWALCRAGALPQETMDYVPKILAAMMISKSPSLYGFRDFAQFEILDYDLVMAPGGTDLKELASQLGVTTKSLRDLNAELVIGYVPSQIAKHAIRIPKGSVTLASEYFSKR